MGANVWPVNAVSGSPQYSGRMLRQTTVAPFTAMGSAARPLGAKSGIRPGTPASIVAVTSTTWTVHAFGGVIDGESAAIAGPYGYAFDTDQTGTVTAAAGSARIDRLDVQVSDPAESDGSSTPAIKVIYTAGTAGSGSAPAAPARSHKLATISVPASGGGAPTISWVPEWSGDPGEWTFNTVAERDAYVALITAANVPPQQQAFVLADPSTFNNGAYTWNGSTAFVRGVAGTITGSNGFTPSAATSLLAVNGMAILACNMTCATGAPSNPNVMGTIPAGFRPGNTVRGGALLFAAGQPGGFEITAAGQLSVYNQSGTTGVTSIYFTTTYPIGG